MHYLLDLLQGAGLAAAIGIRPFLPALLVGALATQNLGVDFGGTNFAFLESPAFLLAALVLVVVFGIAERRTAGGNDSRDPVFLAFAVVSAALGALVAAGSIADRSTTWWPGVFVGLVCVVLAIAATRGLFARVRQRLDAGAAAALPVYAEGIALLGAGLSVLFPPLALVLIGGLIWLLAGSRRREGEKYAGLRILR